MVSCTMAKNPVDSEKVWAVSGTGEDFQCVQLECAQEQQAEIERLRGLLLHYAEWVEQIYGDLQKDQYPGPPRSLVEAMRKDAAPPQEPTTIGLKAN